MVIAKRGKTRVALWTARTELLCDAQELEARAGFLFEQYAGLMRRAEDKRKRAADFKLAAEELGKLDDAGL